MSFQYPANPADGDVIVRGDLLATYNEASNTWQVGQLNPVAGIPGPAGPQGVKGDKGDQGVGLDVDGSVPTYADLPAPPFVNLNDVYVVEETGHGWIYTDRGWIDLGVIIQGPQGVQGPQGDPGTSIAIAGTITDIVPGSPNGPPSYSAAGTMYIYSGSDTAIDGHGFVSDGATPTSSYTDIGQIQGPEGPQGPAGPVGPVGPESLATQERRPLPFVCSTCPLLPAFAGNVNS